MPDGRLGAIRPTRPILPAMRRLLAFVLLATLFAACGSQPAAGSDRPVRILTGAPTSLDPAVQGDAGSAAITAQLFESLTTFDLDLQVRPALAESWRFDDGGRQVTFHLRSGLTFSDGSPIRPSDVRRSWLRLIDPAHPSPLASLALDIKGAEDYLRGRSADPASVALRADDPAGDLVVDLVRPATDFVNIVAGPSFAVVPPGVGTDQAALLPGPGFVASGGYVLTGTTATGLSLTANSHYWAGTPAVSKIELVGDLGGGSPVEAFENGDLDYTGVSSVDASWIAYDKTLGPQLRKVGSLSTEYYGFDTSRPPFSDVRIRKAFGEAIDWRRMAALSGTGETVQVANSMVPPGIPGRSDADHLPKYDPADARKLLADAGYPGGAGFPSTVTDDRRQRVRRGDRVRGQARARGHAALGDDGRRLLRPPGHGRAGDVVACLGRGLPGPERLPRRAPRDGRLQQLRQVELADVRRGDRRGRLGDRSGRRVGGL